MRYEQAKAILKDELEKKRQEVEKLQIQLIECQQKLLEIQSEKLMEYYAKEAEK